MRAVAIFNAGPFRDMSDGLYDYLGGDNDTVFARALGLRADQVIEVRVRAGEGPPEIAGIAAVVVTGSVDMVTDRHPWAERTAAWIAAHRNQVPMLGVCFGNQLIAHALGGRVEWTPEGPEYGTARIETLPAATSDPLFRGIETRFAAQAAHSQRVAELPKGGVQLAENAYGLQAGRYGDLAWGVQFHPEFDRGLMEVLFSSYHQELGRIGVDVAAARAGLAETPVAMRVLQNFAALVRAREAVLA